MTALTREAFIDKAEPIRSFTCTECGGFKYQQVPFFPMHMDTAVCEDCFRNIPVPVLKPRITKPGQHEVLVSIRDCYVGNSRDLKGWIKAAFGTEDEDAAAALLQQVYMDVWKEHYRQVTGEDWA